MIPRYSLEFRRRIWEVSFVMLFTQHFGIGYLRLWPGRQRTVFISIPKRSTKFFSSPNRHDRLWGPTSLSFRWNRAVFIVASPPGAEVKNASNCISIFAHAFKAWVRTTLTSSLSLSPFYYGVFWLYYQAFSTAQVTSNGWMAVNEQGRMWKEADAKYFKGAVLAFFWIQWGTVQKITVMIVSGLRTETETSRL